MSKKHILVLMGGKSAEYEVSMHSGGRVFEAVDRSQYDATPVHVTKTGEWIFPNEDGSPGEPLSIYDAIHVISGMKVDCALLVFHGAYGEDGRIQALFDLLEIPYTSSNSASSALAFDKIRAKAVAKDAGIPIARQLVLQRIESVDRAAQSIMQTVGLPCVLKPSRNGSSVGMSIPLTEEELDAALKVAFEYDTEVLVEEYLKGVEVTCGVLDTDPAKPPRALPLTEIRPVSAQFFDYEAKYTPGASKEITPAEVSPEISRLVQQYSVCAHQAIGCGIWSRHDFIITEAGPIWLEANTIPGMTQTSLFPQGAAAIGIGYTELLSIFIESAIRHYGSR